MIYICFSLIHQIRHVSQSAEKLSIMVDQRSMCCAFVIWCTTAFALVLLSFAQSHVVETSLYPTPCLVKSDSCGPGEACIESQCVCNTTAKLVYDKKLDNCTLLAGSDCSDSDDDFFCVLNAECDDTGKCTCDPGFEVDLIGECRKTYSEPCHDPDALCNAYAFLNCNNRTKTCLCSDTGMAYDSNQRKCVAVAGSYCEFEAYLFPSFRRDCGPHAECRKKPELEGHSDYNLTGVCECLPGFLTSESGRCVRGYMGECQVSSDCETKFCNVTSGSCECPPETQAFDPVMKACGLKIGAACLTDDVSARCLSSLTCDPESKTCGSKDTDKKKIHNSTTLTVGESTEPEPELEDEPLADPDSGAGFQAAILLVASMLLLVVS